MKIAMFTNAYPPHVGGVARSVYLTVENLIRQGHSALVATPSYEGDSDDGECEAEIVRVHSLKNISGSDFSLPFPFSVELAEALSRFAPDIIHSHYPFLLGDMALRYGAMKRIPVVFTHHTRYEAYENLLPFDMDGFDSFVTELSTGYANLCDRVIVPTAGMVAILRDCGVDTPVSVIPTGIDVHRFSRGDGAGLRRRYGIAKDAFVAGYVGRLAPEKNLDFWSEAVCLFLEKKPSAHALVVGGGEFASAIKEAFRRRGLSDRLSMTGVLEGESLVDAYHAMDVFAFTSLLETQGLVLAEALASGCPVVALEAQCVRDVVPDGSGGYLVRSREPRLFCSALEEFAEMTPMRYKSVCNEARKNARRFDVSICIRDLLEAYSSCLGGSRRPGVLEVTGWLALGRMGKRELNLWKSRISALINAVKG